MREFLFRGKDKYGKWIYGSFVHEPKQKHLPSKNFIFTPDSMMLHDVDPETVGQYTGLKDCEGKKIFEGDIVEVEYWDPSCSECKKFRGIVEHDGYLLGSLDDHFQNCTVKIIGSKFDNPELLEETK